MDFKVKYILVKDFIKRKKMQKVFNIYYSIRKKPFQIIYQLSCFAGHPVIMFLVLIKLTNLTN